MEFGVWTWVRGRMEIDGGSLGLAEEGKRVREWRFWSTR